MAHTIILHVLDEDPVVGEIEVMPNPSDAFIIVSNPRRLDGNELHYLAAGVVDVIWPMHRVNFIEMMPADDEEIIGFVRE